jgi:ribonuclease HII
MLKELDKKFEGYVGIDEAGLGNIAGSLIFVGAKLKVRYNLEDIAFANDSKSMSKKKREKLYKDVIKFVDYHIVELYASFIDKEGREGACKTALEMIKNYFGCDSKFVYDGNNNHKVQGLEMLIKADAKVSIVAAASIIAKVEKDKRMKKWDEKYPMYDWKNNAGYGTKAHIEAIKNYGWTELHRRSYNIKALEGLNVKEYMI